MSAFVLYSFDILPKKAEKMELTIDSFGSKLFLVLKFAMILLLIYANVIIY